MKIDEFTSSSVNTYGGGENPPCVGLASSVLPETRSVVAIESSQTGVSTRNAHTSTAPHWYALRTTYGREK